MDERHWWIAGKIQESFHIGGFDNPTLLEDFLCDSETLDLINQFLCQGGQCRLFFYCDRPEHGVLSARELHATCTLSVLREIPLDEITVLYFLRPSVESEVDATHMEKHVYCGELKGNTIENLTNMISDIYMPLLKAQKHWGQCTADNQLTLMHTLEKTLSSLNESSSASHTSKHVMLRQPESLVGADFKQHRLAASDPQVITEYESLVTDWMNTIESILHDTSDERFMDPNAGPLSELDRWKRRQRLLMSITEQLKGKECKAVIGVLITAKSRLLKRWKLIDSGITDSMNETKDKVRYLESLKRHLDQLYHGATPNNIMGVALPGLINTVKQMDSISRFYARQGFLGLLFTKVTNQIVLTCKEYIQQCTMNFDDEDLLWEKVCAEVNKDSQTGTIGIHGMDASQKQLQSQLENRLRGRPSKQKQKTFIEKSEESLFCRLKACLALQSYYRDAIRSLRDALGASQNLSHFTSLSSLQGPSSVQGGRTKLSSSGNNSQNGPNKQGTRLSIATLPTKRTSSIVTDHEGHGVSVADEETIMHHLEAYCNRIRHILDVINTLTQYNKMLKTTEDLPRPRQEDLVIDERERRNQQQQEQHEDQHLDKLREMTPGSGKDRSLVAIAESMEEQMSDDAQMNAGRDDMPLNADEAHDVVNLHYGLNKKEVNLLKRFYPEDCPDDGPSITSVVQQHVDKMKKTMVDSVTTNTMLDVESKDKDRFDEIYADFLSTVKELEVFLAAYLHAVFVRKMKTQEGLALMTKFIPVQQRPGVRLVVAEKFIEIFSWYEADLDQIQTIYETHKDSPPLMRNAPPVAGAIVWSRQLLKRIEDPMKLFRDNKAVTHLKDFGRIVKVYNRLATALVTFESLWFTHWKTSVDQARNGLRATLFVLHPDTKDILVNADEKVLQLIHEAKWLTRLDIQIPESAQQILQQESRFKAYKDHLELCLVEHRAVLQCIPPSLTALFEGHIEQAHQNFQPGLSTLAWNSMNIDAFLHQIHTGTSRLQYLVDRVNDIIKNRVEATIDKIHEMIFFDYKTAFSKSWPPNEFTEVMGESVKLKSEELYEYISIIEAGVREAAFILTGKKGVPSRIGELDSRGGGEKSSISTEYLASTATRGAVSSIKPEDRMMGTILDCYRDQIYRAVLLATTRTLVTLAESSGCQGEVVRAASVLSQAASSSKDIPFAGSLQAGSGMSPSRITSATSEKSQPISVLSMLSDMTWTTEKTHDITYLRFEVEVKFSIPNITLEPSLDAIQTAINVVARNIMQVPQGVTWCSDSFLGEEFLEQIHQDDVVDELIAQVNGVVEELKPTVKQHLLHFGMYDFLWRDDMYGNYFDFISNDPGLHAINKEVERLLKVEHKVVDVPGVLPVGPICLHTDPIKDALHGFAMAWKNQYASILHEEAKKKLDAAVLYRSNVRQRLELSVANLDQLNSTLQLLEELNDMESKMDDLYLPIENMYAKLREFELRLPRGEVEEVAQLRDNWQHLLDLAEEVRQQLLKEKRSNFEQELDKQVKTFVVEVIQFRNAFDAQGPAVPGIPPSDAVHRLQDFQQRYSLYDVKRKTLDSVSKLFGITCKPFAELDKTGEELELLGLLYGLFQKFIRFDERFRDTLWSEVDLSAATREVESYWDECLALPSKLKDWDAYNDMKSSIQQYRDVFPLLHKLASKEIRNRHWLQVMAVTGSSFQLEANVFRLQHLLDIGLIKHRTEIEEICRSASRELELEVKLRVTEEEWTEQVLNFEHYKKRGPMYLDKVFTERLLEQLEDAQALLAQMLTSRYIGPLREEAAAWAEKLKEVGEVLDQWLDVQDLWHYLESVFSNPDTAKELPQEAKRFARIDKGWTKMMKRAYDTRNVLQCCYGEEVPKGVVLRHFYQELEVCFKSLTTYLDNKRHAFPRFYFVSDPVLLAILSRPHDLDSVKPHLRSLFSGIHTVQLEKQQVAEDDLDPQGDVVLQDGRRLSSRSPGSRGNASSASPHMGGQTPTKIDKRLTTVHKRNGRDLKGNEHASGNKHKDNMQHSVLSSYGGPTMLPSELIGEEMVTMEAHTVNSAEGETLHLLEKVPLINGVEDWLNHLQQSVNSTLREMITSIAVDINNGMPCDEWAHKYPTQICRLGMLYYWTRECEQGVAELKYDRKALNSTSRRFGNTTSKLPAVLSKGCWRTLDDAMLPMHKLRLENMITQSLFMRDMIEFMSNRKLREATDFEWRRNLRYYLHDKTESEPQQAALYILDQQYDYGCEFYGAQPIIGHSPMTDRCFLSMSQALVAGRGAMVTGGTSTGKTETIKAFAQTLGKFLVMFQCSSHVDPGAVGRILQGMARDGCWSCLDAVQLLHKEGMAVLLDHLQAVMSALRSRASFCHVADGQEVPVKPSVAVFASFNPTVLPSYTLPNDLRALFRQVAIIKPEVHLVLKAKCSTLGLKSPSVLAMRLKLVSELARDQLPEAVHHSFSIAALTGVLQRASQKRRQVREPEKSSDRIDLKRGTDTQEPSRSNSVLSTITSNQPQQQSSTTLLTTGRGKKGGTPNPMSAAAKVEHAVVGQTLLDLLQPRLTQENQAIFRQIVKDVFSGLPEPPSQSMAMSALSRSVDVESALESTAAEYGLVPHKAWRDKCMQLYNIAQVHQGIIVAGPPGSGKSSVIQSLVDALCVNPRGLSRGSNKTKGSDLAESNHKLQKLYPLVVDDLSLIFGHLNQNHDWVDGIFTSAWRKATRNQSTTWLCLDGALNASWADSFSSVLDASKTLHLANGDELFLSANIKLLFETDELSQATPALIARSGILYLDKTVVGWRPIAKAWLENRSQQEVHVLQRSFDKTVDAVTTFVNDCKTRLRLSEIGMFMTCLNLLSAMLADNIEIGGELHIERLYLFCMMWSYGGLLEDKDRKGFNDLLATLSTALPDDDRDICFFDYYVDESGEWDPWQSRVPEAIYTEHLDLLGEVFIDTIDSIRTRLLIDFACASGQNVLLVGPPGSGKTSMINEYLDSQDPQNQITKKLVYSGASKAQQLQNFIECNIYHRQGYVYGAKDNKKLQLFIDDLNLPNPDEHGIQRCNELLRRMLDDRTLCTLQRPFEWRTLEGLTVLSAMSLSDCPSLGDKPIAPRLLRHFAVLQLRAPADESLKTVVHGILEAAMLHGDHPGLDIELHNALVTASCKMLTAVKQVLRPTAMPGRRHYLFTLKDISTCFTCLKRLADESRADDKIVVSLWRHEMERLMRDRLCRHADLLWFDHCLNETTTELWPDLVESLHKNFVTFPVDARVYNRPVTTLSKKEVRVMLQPVDSMKEVHNCLQSHLNRYNEEFGNVYLDIMLSDNVLGHIIKMHRVLSYHHGGNFLLIGPIGSHLGTLIKLALHVADLPIHPIDSSKPNTFFDGLRSAIRLTGSEGKTLALFFNLSEEDDGSPPQIRAKGRDLENEQYLDAINSVLISGEYPHLFTNDEMDGLLQAIIPAIKREHGSAPVDPNKFFVSRVMTNLHTIICLPPQHKLHSLALSQYRGLLSGCQVIYLCDWTKEALLSEAVYYLNKNSLTQDCESELAESVITCMANIHSFVLHDCRQTKWVGDNSDEISMTQVKVNDRRKDQLKTTTVKMPNKPYSKAIMLENIKLRHRNLDVPTTSELFIGPTTYRRFMNTFCRLYQLKAKERTEHVTKLKKSISTIDQTRKDAKSMRENIKTITKKFETAKNSTEDLLKQLTVHATILEKLKAKVGMATSLSAFLQMNELEEEEEQEDDLLKEEERDEYDDDFDKMREANLKTRTVAAVEEHETAKKTVEDCRSKLSYAKQQVLHWKTRVDRQCIERLKAFQNPPILVGHVMEMVMTLIGKRLPSQRLHLHSDNYPGNDMMSGHFSASSSSTKFTSTMIRKPKGKDGERFDRAEWKRMQGTMTESTKFVDMLHNVPWEDGLPDDVTMAVESYLARSQEGQLGVTGEGTMLENASEKEKAIVAVKRSPSPDNTKGITIAAAKYSSEDAAVLVNYSIAIVEYTRLCGPLRNAMERMQELKREIEENDRMQKERENEPEKTEEDAPKEEQTDDLTEADLPRIQEISRDLQTKFDSAVEEKHLLEMDLVSMRERLKAATDMIEGLRHQEQEWRHHVKEHCNNDMLVGNCITASAFLTYCGGMNTDTRRRMGDFFLTICEHHGLPLPSHKLYKNMELSQFLYPPVTVYELEEHGLPQTRLMLENACFLMQGDTTMAWPFVCDPTSRVVGWIKDYLQGHGLISVRYSDLRSQLDTCLADGSPLLITDVDVASITKDLRFQKVLHCRDRFVAGKVPFKLLVGDHEVECDPRFRMYLHTATLPHEVPPELAAYVALLFFHQLRVDIEDELLTRFMIKEKARLNEEKNALLNERLENMHKLDTLEKQMVDTLACDVRLLNELPTIKRMAELKKQFDETQEGQARVEASEESIARAKESFRLIAKRGAVCFDTTQYLREVNPLYQTSFDQFLSIYDSSISHSDRASVKAVVDRLVQASFWSTIRCLAERDRHLYSLLLALEVEDSEGRVGPGEREFLVSPSLGSVTMTSLGFTQPQESKFVQAKKPFDWMSDDQFNNLQILAIHYEWFQDMFDRMPRDGRETQWRTLCESDAPENISLPDRMDDHYTALQRLLVVRATRSDRLIQLSTIFINSVMGKKFCGEITLDLGLVQRQSSPRTPVLMLYTTERDTADKLVQEFAQKRQVPLCVVPLSGAGPVEERTAKKCLQKAMLEGEWVLLQNGHNALPLIQSLEGLFAEQDHVDVQFRCWVTAQALPSLPVRVLQTSVKVMIDTPKGIKEGVLRAFNYMDVDILKQTSRPEWPAMLHNLCYLHGALRLRARFGRGGWNMPSNFLSMGNSEIYESIKLAVAEFQDNLTCPTPEGTQIARSTSWTGVRFMLSEIIYGNHVTDGLDLQSMTAMIDYWISPNAVKRDFELARLKYKLPPVFFNPHPRMSQLIQAVENLPSTMLECPEACNLHPSSEGVLGDDQYIFTRLNKVLDAMPSSSTLTHQLFPRAPTPFDGPPMANISNTSNNPQVVNMGVFASASFATLRMKKEAELWEVCHNMLPKVPKAYSKDFITERVKKVGGFTSFNLYLMKELDIMYQLLTDIRTTLQAIKQACELTSMGDLLTPQQLEAADDLYHLRIPRYWAQLAGHTGPPPNQSLATWLIDLNNRCQHFERILVLGREKMPAYWLGAFFYPRGLLALLKQDCYRHHSNDRSGSLEHYVFQTEITARDKDHIRDPPAEGMFVFGIYLWGCAWEKTNAELVDQPPRNTCAALPVVHLTCWPQGDKPLLQDPARAVEVFPCPVYQSRIAPKLPIMELDLYHTGIPAQRWALRGLAATVRPF